MYGVDENLISKWNNEAKTTYCDAGDLSSGCPLLDLNHGAPSFRPGIQLTAHKLQVLTRNYLSKEIVVDFQSTQTKIVQTRRLLGDVVYLG
jgi:hypothetical protein